MEKSYDILLGIQKAQGRIAKESILKKYEDNAALQLLLQVAFDPYIVTNIGAAKLKKYPYIGQVPSYMSPYDLSKFLRSGLTGTRLQCEEVNKFIAAADEKHKKLIHDIATKTLKIGVTATTLNKIYGKNFIPIGGCMLGTSLKDVSSAYQKGNFIVTEKYDGQRKCLVKHEDGSIEIFSGRNWMPDTNYPDIIEEAKQLPNGYVYDGEMLAVGTYKDSIAQRQATSSICNSKSPNKKGVEFYLFDIIPLKEFKTGKCNASCITRKTTLSNTLLYKEFKFIKEAKIIGIVKDCNEDQITSIVKEIWDRGGEGIMLNSYYGSYEIKRSKELLKVKKVEEYDLRIVGYEFGTFGTKNQNVCGALVVLYKGHKVSVGSGLSDYERADIAANFEDKYLNKICTVATFGESNNATKNISLNAPIFRGMRYDKEEADYEM